MTERPTRPDLVGLRLELFTDDLERLVDFYTTVMGFAPVRNEPQNGYAVLVRGAVELGILVWSADGDQSAARRPPVGAEIVIEVDDIKAERNAVVAAGGRLEEDLVTRPWGLRDFRLVDPDGYYLRITNRG